MHDISIMCTLNLYVMHFLNKTIHATMINSAIICSDFKPSIRQQRSLSNGCYGQHQHLLSNLVATNVLQAYEWGYSLYLWEHTVLPPTPKIIIKKHTGYLLVSHCTMYKAWKLLIMINLVRSKLPCWRWCTFHSNCIEELLTDFAKAWQLALSPAYLTFTTYL